MLTCSTPPVLARLFGPATGQWQHCRGQWQQCRGQWRQCELADCSGWREGSGSTAEGSGGSASCPQEQDRLVISAKTPWAPKARCTCECGGVRRRRRFYTPFVCSKLDRCRWRRVGWRRPCGCGRRRRRVVAGYQRASCTCASARSHMRVEQSPKKQRRCVSAAATAAVNIAAALRDTLIKEARRLLAGNQLRVGAAVVVLICF